YRLRSLSPAPPPARERFTRQVRYGSPPLLRHEQCPLPALHAHRHLGARQGQSFHTTAAERRADPLGFWFGRTASSASLPLVGRTLAAGNLYAARCDVS